MKYRMHISATDKKLGGVCAGLAESLDIDVTLVRVIAFLICIFQPFAIILYFIMSICLPSGAGEPLKTYKTAKPNSDSGKPGESKTERAEAEKPKAGTYTHKTYSSAQANTAKAHYNSYASKAEKAAAYNYGDSEFYADRDADGSYTGDYEPENKKGGFNIAIAVVLICTGIGILLSHYVFGYPISFDNVSAFMILAAGLLLLLGGLFDKRKNSASKVLKLISGGILTYTGVAKVIDSLGISELSGLGSSYIFTAATSMWQLFVFALIISFLFPRKKTIAVVWCLFIVAIVAGSVIISIFGSFAAFLIYLGI